MTVTRRIRRRGEHEISRKTIAQGTSDYSGEPVVTISCAFYTSHARLRVHWAPGVPCALSFEAKVLARLARSASRDRGVVSGLGHIHRFNDALLKTLGKP